MTLVTAIMNHSLCFWCGQETSAENHPAEKHSVEYDVDGVMRTFHQRPRNCLSEFLLCKKTNPKMVDRVLERKKEAVRT